MFEKLKVPLLGLVENMAWYELPNGERDYVFGQGGGVALLSHQLVRFYQGLRLAALLNRTLVLPHLLGHGTAQIRAPHSSAFDVQAARAAIAPLRVEEMEPWLRLGIAPQA